MKNFTFDLNDFPKWAVLHWIEFEINTSIDAIKKLIVIQDGGFNVLHDDLKKKILEIQVQNKNMDEQDLDSYINHLFGIEEQLIDELKKTQNFSKITTVFIFFETKLKMICDTLRDDFIFNPEIKKTNSVILKYPKFLRLFLEEEFDKIEKFWTPLINQYTLRNIIVHQGGIATKNQYDEIFKLEGLDFREFEKLYYLEVQESNIYVNALLEKIELYFEKLFGAIRLKTDIILQ